MEIFKIVGLGIIISIMLVIVKQIKPELSVALLVAGSIVMLIMIFKYFTNAFSVFETIIEKTGIDGNLFSVLLKIIGIGYLVEFGAGICNDTGNGSVGDKVVLGGKILIFIVAIPIITNLLEIVIGLIP